MLLSEAKVQALSEPPTISCKAPPVRRMVAKWDRWDSSRASREPLNLVGESFPALLRTPGNRKTLEGKNTSQRKPVGCPCAFCE